MKNTLVSFIIPHKGREQYLQQTIQSITMQDFDLSMIEVIIVTQNDKLSDDTLRFQDELMLSVHHRPDSDSISALRNYGAHKADSEYLAFIDADISLSPNWLNRMIKELQQPESDRVLISAIQTNSKQANSVERIRTVLNNIQQDSYVDSLHGSNLFLTTATFISAGGFPEDLQTCEDVYFTTNVSKLGKLYLTSKATFIHLGEDKEHSGMFKKEIWRGLSNLQSFKGRKVPLRELPSIVIPVAIMLLFITSTTMFISGFYMLALFSAALMLFPVVAYTARLRKHSTDQRVSIINLLAFYTVYFCARSIGTYKGLFKSLLDA